MGATRSPSRGTPSRDDLEARLSGPEFDSLRWWSSAPGDTFEWHRHPRHKVLYCAEGSIVFHTSDGDLELGPGDRLDLPPGTDHAATIGERGVACVEAFRDGS